MKYKLPRHKFKFNSMVVLLVVFMVALLTTAQYFLHYSYSQKMAKSFEDNTVRLLEKNLPSMLVYPMGMEDKKEISRIATEVIYHDFIYSIEIRDRNGALLDYKSDPMVNGDQIPITVKEIKIADNRTIVLDEFDEILSGKDSERELGYVLLGVTQTEAKKSANTILITYIGILVAVILLAVGVVYMVLRGIGVNVNSAMRSLNSIDSDEYKPIEEDSRIYELSELFTSVNSMAKTVHTSLDRLRNTEKYQRVILEIVSHEMRQPLNALSPMLSMLKKQIEPRGDLSFLQDQLRICNSSAEQLISVMDQLLDLTLIMSESNVLDEIEFYPEELFDRLHDVFLPSVKKRVRLMVRNHSDSSHTVGYCKGDATKIARIVSNLLSNATKYTETGIIDLDWKITGSDKNQLQIIVSDTGCGIDEKNLKRVFNSSFREAGVGNGLGLTIVGSLVRFLKGNASIESKKDVGTKISIEIPIKYYPSDLHSNSGFDFKTLENIKNVVVIDDANSNCIALSTVLADYGITSYPFTKTREAIEFIDAQSDRLDIVFVDYSMPEVSGIDLIEAIKHHNLIVVCVTAHVQPKVIHELEGLIQSGGGLHYFLKKPIRKSEIEALLKKIAESKIALSQIIDNIKNVED